MQYEAPQWSQPQAASTGGAAHDPSTTTFGFTPPPPVKRHAACDECRKRKLKCSGEPAGCSRCIKQSLVCHYSIQKQMGRPPKKRMREDDDNLASLGLSSSDLWANPENSQLLSSGLGAETTADLPDPLHLFSSTYSSPFDMPQSIPPRLSTTEDHRHAWQLSHGESLNPIPATNTPWPDFSSVTAAAPNPFVPPGFTPPITPSDSGSSDNQCSCLSYLYLCLSHLSSLTPFPISQHTICSLFISSNTAQAVLRCQACPTRFDTGMQNVMFLGTLLNVMADGWLRIFKADATELGRQVTSPAFIASINRSGDPTAAWKDWLHQTVRHGVLGGTLSDPEGRPSCSESPSVLALIEEMEARQRHWHSSPECHPLPQEKRLNMPSDQIPTGALDPREEQDLLCLKVAKSARNVIDKFGFDSHEFPNNVSPPASLTPSHESGPD